MILRQRAAAGGRDQFYLLAGVPNLLSRLSYWFESAGRMSEGSCTASSCQCVFAQHQPDLGAAGEWHHPFVAFQRLWCGVHPNLIRLRELSARSRVECTDADWFGPGGRCGSPPQSATELGSAISLQVLPISLPARVTRAFYYPDFYKGVFSWLKA